MVGEQILWDRTPPGRLGIFKKRIYRMDAGTGQIVYVYFQNPTYPGDFPGTDFVILLRCQLRVVSSPCAPSQTDELTT